MLVGSPGFVLHGRQCSAVVLLVFSGHRQAFHSHVAAGSLLHRRDLTLVVLRPDALDGGLWLSKMQHMEKFKV